ncbi:probable tRNA N6-adenosine threonylcarbamoyltransferase, mitochondrial [Bombyx mandarina]|uniref:N(6)-L-threonylcarbamoyladenine synthase n=1 Tax=Bombyx mandarina TaxID=7092 RepID=A0A6J2JLD0_BOMMA|nr:probable tRNA N6-adenosine threonylcarbamoyltransferase, mitochondrial [Bombyx mandarina]
MFMTHRNSRLLRILRQNRWKTTSCSNDFTILGIETSCDDTGCAVIDGAGNVLGESLYSQNAIHVRYGGVNPFIAHELHREHIETAVTEALSTAKIKIKDIDAVAVTVKPGLLLSLQVGVQYAKYICMEYNKPIIPVHHMEAHALVARIYHNLPFPFIVLLISGGHCLLCLVQDVNQFFLLGESLDNAPGEILDKVARRMKLKNIKEYSQLAGGKAVEEAAKKANNSQQFQFPLPLNRNRDCNFSFSGLKDSLVRKLIKKEKEHGITGDCLIPEYNDLCASFQIALAEHLGHRLERAIIFCEEKNLINPNNKNIVVSGGVACNDFIFKSMQFVAGKSGYSCYRPPPKVCTDNGIMIAWNGVEKLKKSYQIQYDLPLSEIDPIAPLGKSLIHEVKCANIPVKVTKLTNLL